MILRARSLRPRAPARPASLAASVAALLVAACLPSDTGRPLGGRCEGAECEGGLLCLYGRCRSACLTDRDCPASSLCVVGPDGARGCTLVEEEGCSSDTCEPGTTCVGGQCVPHVPDDGGDGDADADAAVDADLDQRAEIIRALAGGWVGVFYMMDGDGCLCLSLDEQGDVDTERSSVVLHAPTVDNFPITGGQVTDVSTDAPDHSVLIELLVVGGDASFSGTFHSVTGSLEGDFVPPGAAWSYPMTLDRTGTSCADRIGVPEAGC